MSKTVFITGAESGFGKGVAIGLAKKGHKVIAGVQVEPLKTILLADANTAGVELEVIVLDVTKESDRQYAFSRYAHAVDVVISNAGVMESGPVAEIPMEKVRRNYEVNVFSSLAIARGFLPSMVKKGKGRMIFTSSMGGLLTMPFAAIYTSTKHALEGIAEGLKDELFGTGVEICTINPGVYGTGFNDRGAETMEKWFDPANTLTKPEVLQAAIEGGDLKGQLDPQELIEAMIRVAEEENPKFRNVVPEVIIPWIQATQAKTWETKQDDTIFINPKSL